MGWLASVPTADLIELLKYSEDQPRDERGRFAAGGAGDAGDWQGRQLPEGYYYHGTHPDNFESIRAEGLQPGRPRVSLGRVGAIYFDRADQQRFSTDHGNVLLRVPNEVVGDLPRHAGGYISTEPVPASALEYYGRDGSWHSLTVTKGYSEDEPRDERGRWTDGGGWADPGAKPEASLPPGFDAMTTDQQMDVFRANRLARDAWDRTIAYGVATGKIAPEEAFARGWSPSLPRGQDSIGPLPDTMYHATVAMDSVLENGLKTQDELVAAGLKSTGLGGGTSDTISLTTDKGFADRIAETIVESHDVATGKIGVSDLVGRAQAGGFIEGDAGLRALYETLNGPGSYDLVQKDQTRVNSYTEGFPGAMIASHDEMVKAFGDLGWTPAPDAGHVTGGDGQDRYTAWLRPSTPDEQVADRFSLYRSFLAAQSASGGPTDPVFWSPDPKYYANIDPSQVGVVEAHPVPGAVGYYVGPAEAEWRTWSGDALTVAAVKAVRPDLRKYSEDEPRDERGRWTDGGGGGDAALSSLARSVLADMGDAFPAEAALYVTDRTGVPVQLNERVDPAAFRESMAQFVALQETFHADVDKIVVEPIATKVNIGETGLSIHSVQARTVGDDAGHSVITLNSNTFTQTGLEILKASTGWTVAGTNDPAGLITHEYAHAIDYMAMAQAKAMVEGGDREGQNLMASDPGFRWRIAGMPPGPSGYATTNPQEQFAEYFAGTYAGHLGAFSNQEASVRAYVDSVVTRASKMVTKYSPDQPRDERGRFSSGGGEFAEMPLPGEPSPEERASWAPRDAALSWSGGTSDAPGIGSQAIREALARGGDPPGVTRGAYDIGRTLVSAVDQAPPTTYPLYRGIGFANQADYEAFASTIKDGAKIDMNLSSWTAVRDTAEKFASNVYGTNPAADIGYTPHQVLFSLEPGAKAYDATWDIAQGPQYREHLTDGRFEVQNVSHLDLFSGGTFDTVSLKQIDTFSPDQLVATKAAGGKAHFLPWLERYMDQRMVPPSTAKRDVSDEPRDEHGRWAAEGASFDQMIRDAEPDADPALAVWYGGGYAEIRAAAAGDPNASPRARQYAGEIADAVAASGRQSPEVWRGINVQPHVLDSYRPGAKLDFNLSSWSERKDFAHSFSSMPEMTAAPVVFHAPGGVTGLPIGGDYFEQEWISDGRFTVGSVEPLTITGLPPGLSVEVTHDGVAPGVSALAGTKVSKRTSPLQFSTAARKALMAAYAASYAAGFQDAYPDVPDWVDFQDWGDEAASQATEKTGGWLDALGAALIGGAVSGALFDAWMGSYAASANVLYEQGFGAGAGAQGMVTQATWHATGDEADCDLCDARNGQTWLGDEEHPYPGEGYFGDVCEGGPNCRCELWYEIVPADETSDTAGETGDGGDLAAAAVPDVTKLTVPELLALRTVLEKTDFFTDEGGVVHPIRGSEGYDESIGDRQRSGSGTTNVYTPAYHATYHQGYGSYERCPTCSAYRPPTGPGSAQDHIDRGHNGRWADCAQCTNRRMLESVTATGQLVPVHRLTDEEVKTTADTIARGLATFEAAGGHVDPYVQSAWALKAHVDSVDEQRANGVSGTGPEYAKIALSQDLVNVATDQNGEVLGAHGFRLENLGSSNAAAEIGARKIIGDGIFGTMERQPGTGSAMVATYIRQAADQNVGILIHPVETAKGFWTKMGMQPLTSTYGWGMTAADAKRVAALLP